MVRVSYQRVLCLAEPKKKKNEKNKYEKNSESEKENRKKMHKKNKKCLSKVKKFCQQIRQGPYFICTFVVDSFISAVPDYLNKKKFIFLPQNCIVQ